MTWIEPIYDRTITDIVYIKKWLETLKLVNNYEPEHKGCLNALDLNRIENNILYLSEELSKYGYITTINMKQWDMTSKFDTDDVTRIMENINNLIEAYHSPYSSTELPSTMTHFTHINDIEYNLFLIYELLTTMISYLPCAGITKAGSRNLLPLRR